MINVATIHWQDMRWVDVQLRYLERFIDRPYRVWSFLGPAGAEQASKFHYANLLPIRPHAWKLDILADMICEASDDDDLVIFIDGDAFPIAPVVPYLEQKLADYPLVAIRRDENDGDPQPHPCFCATTVGFWRGIGADWQRGATWIGPGGEPVTDVGGNLMALLAERQIEWYPMLRSNARNLHPLLFGVYDGVAYHHGAGFRGYGGGRAAQAKRLELEAELEASWRARLIDAVPQSGPFRRLSDRLKPHHPRRRYRARLASEFSGMSEEIYQRIVDDDDIFEVLTNPDYSGETRLETPPLVAQLAI